MGDGLIRIENPSATRELTTLAGNFRRLSDGFLEQAEQSLELARAAGDADAIVREHIKIEVMRAARKMFKGSYRAVAGEGAWPEGGGNAGGAGETLDATRDVGATRVVGATRDVGDVDALGEGGS